MSTTESPYTCSIRTRFCGVFRALQSNAVFHSNKTHYNMTPPNLLIIAGLDPSGGAGLAADIEAASALGAHAAPVASLITVQDTVNVLDARPLPPDIVIAQAQAVLDDMPVHAIKLGALGTDAIGHAIADLLQHYPDIPVVTDPVLVAAGGGALAESELHAVYHDRLFPLSTVATPNREELMTLTEDANPTSLLAKGLPACLVTDGEGTGETIVHELHQRSGVTRLKNGPRLPGSFHGTGCTLASAIAAAMANGDELEKAVARATSYVENAVANAFQPGKGQNVPLRW